MHLFARNDKDQLIHASNAQSGSDYWCVECGSTVRLRSGVYRRPHFFHLSGHQCKSSGKSLEHLQTQLRLQEVIDEIQLEVPFPEIGRIADAVWPTMQLIFEVQCSPISDQEILARNADYKVRGYQVIWIFHLKSFGRRWLSRAEQAVQKSPHYFTDIDKEGNGTIFDFACVLDGTRRQKKIGKFPIDISIPLPSGGEPPRKEWNLRFKGDITDYPEEASQLYEKELGLTDLILWILDSIRRLYLGLLYWQLENSNRN